MALKKVPNLLLQNIKKFFQHSPSIKIILIVIVICLLKIAFFGIEIIVIEIKEKVRVDNSILDPLYTTTESLEDSKYRKFR